MAVEVAVDNSAVFDLVDVPLPKNKEKDGLAFEKIVTLARKKHIEIGQPVTGTFMEALHAPRWKKNEVRKRIGDVLKTWPAPTFFKPEEQQEFECRKRCLRKILPKRMGDDSDNLIVARYHSVYYVTTDYDFHKAFNDRKDEIRVKCVVEAYVLVPSEFIGMYDTGRV